MAISLFTLPLYAGDVTIDWYTIDCGGAMVSTDGLPGGIELGGTIGQHDAGPTSGPMTVGDLEMVGGFWSVIDPPFCAESSECNDQVLCTLDLCDSSACGAQPILYADVNNDGFVNVADTLCELDTFAGNPASAACAESGSGPPVSLEAKDIAPCPTAGDPANMGDGFVNLGDVLATLDVFAGLPQDPACNACAGGP